MAQLVNVSTKRFEEIPDSQAAQALTSGTHAYQKGATVNMVSSQDGNTYSVPAEYVPHFLAQGSKVETEADVKEAKDEAQYGDRPYAAATAGAARGASFGLSDYLGAKLGYGDTLKQLKGRNETASLVGEVGGVAASLLLPGPNLVRGAGLVGEGVAHAVAPLATRVLGEGAELGIKAAAQRIAGQAVAKGAGSAVEGALYGAGQTLSENSLGNVEANGELLASNMGISALIGGAIGAAIPVAGGLLKGGSKFIPAWTQPGEDGYAITKGVNKAYNKLSTLFGADEATASKFFNDANATKNAFALGEKDAAAKIADTADSVISAGGEAKSQAYEVLHSHALSKAASEAVESGNLTAGKDLIDATNAKIGEFKDQVTDSKFFSANTKNGVEIAQLTIEGKSPRLEKQWMNLRDELDLPMTKGETPAFHEIPETATPEQAKKIVSLQYDTALSARKEFDKAISTTDAKFAAGGNDVQLYQDMRKALNEVVKKAPGFGEDVSRLNEVFSSYKQNFEDLSKAMSDKAGDLHIQRAVNLVKSSGAKGSMVDSMLDSAGEFVGRLKTLQHDASLAPEAKAALEGVTEKLEKSYQALSDLREAGRGYGDLQALKGMAGPSGSGAGIIGQAVLAGSGHVGFGAALAPMTSPYYYLKGLTTLRGVLGKQVDAVRLAKIERIIGGENRTVADVAANSIKALAKATRAPAIMMQSKNTVEEFKDRQAMLRQMQNVDPTELYQSIHNLVGQPAPAHAVATAKVANTAVQFLASKLPAPPNSPAAALAFEKRDPLPSKQEMQSFNATFEAVENPKMVFEALGNGTLKPEHVDALKTVYPQMYKEVGTALTTYLTNHPGELPYSSRLRLGMWFGQATTKELAQPYIAASQKAFAQQGPESSQTDAPQVSKPGLGKITLGHRTSTPTQLTMAGKNS